MITFLYILACSISFVPVIFYYFTKDDRLKWFSKIFCDNCNLFIFAFIVYLLAKEHKRFIVRKSARLGFEFWIASIVTSNIDCISTYLFHKSLLEEMIILNLIPAFWIIGRFFIMVYRLYKKMRYQNENRGTV